MKHSRLALGILVAVTLVAFAAGCEEAEGPVAPPTAAFTMAPMTGNAPLLVHFTSTSVFRGAGSRTWAWDFGDGGTSGDENPTHTFNMPGTYAVMLTVSDSGGSDTFVHGTLVTVEAPPAPPPPPPPPAASVTANFSSDVTSGTAPLTVQFTDLSAATSAVTSWAWDFGDGATSTLQDPSHTYAAAGTYAVQLTASIATASDTETKTGYVTVTAATVVGKPTNGTGGSTGTVTASYNNRSYKLYVPASYKDATPTPIVVFMHGLGDTYTNFFTGVTYYGWKASADNRGYIIMVPDNKNATRASFLHFSGSTFDWTATQAEMNDLLACIYYGVGSSYNIQTTNIYWTGFSEGGTFTALAAYALCKELHACAPYAGCVSGKSFPMARKIPVYSVCGTLDYSYTQIKSAFQEWVTAGHPTNSSWVTNVSHSYSGLLTSGPSADSVYQWMSTVTCQPVVSGLP